MMNTLAGIIETTESDLDALDNSRVTVKNKPVMQQIIKKSAACEMIKAIDGIIQRHKDSPELYDVLKANLFNITIQKKIIGDCTISLAKPRTSTKNKKQPNG